MRRNEPSPEAGAEIYERYRPLLFSIADRMLGSVSDSEDILQEAFVRWQRASVNEEIRSPKSYLSALVTNLCIDQLRSAKVRREKYFGSWLPEPLLTERGPEIDEALPLDETLSLAFLVLLESLSPVERAVFVFREVFAYGYPEISRIVNKSEANCRQIARRARQSIAARRPRFESSPEQEERLARGFIAASTSGDMEELLALLSEDVILYSDGGGKARAPLRPIYGADKVARFLTGVLGKEPPASIDLVRVNDEPAIVAYDPEGWPVGVVALEISGGRIGAMYLVVNPEKLGRMPSVGELDEKERS
jgi:RNA polymerase sigma-70 factor (ECF subfamily)